MFFGNTTIHLRPPTAMASNFFIQNNRLHLFLCILLAGDIAVNPGPITPSTNVCLGNTEMVMLFNCRSLLPKVDELRAAFESVKPLFIATTETWLNKDINNMEVDILADIV